MSNDSADHTLRMTAMAHSATKSARPLTRRAFASAAAATAMVLLTACGGGSEEAGGTDSHELHGTPQSFTAPPEATPALPDQFATVDQLQPDSVMVAALETLFSYQPTVDLGQGEAAQRAAPLMDERFYRENAASMAALAPITGKRWQSWRTFRRRTRGLWRSPWRRSPRTARRSTPRAGQRMPPSPSSVSGGCPR